MGETEKTGLIESPKTVALDGTVLGDTDTIPLLKAHFLDQADAASFIEAHSARILAVIGYHPHTTVSGSFPFVQLHLTPIQRPRSVEVWLSPLPVTYQEHSGTLLSMNEELLFGSVVVENADEKSLDEATFTAYRRFLAGCRRLGYPHLIRVWNMFPAINEPVHGLERYRQFCIGRHRAFAEDRTDFQGVLPAASAMGTRSGPFQIYFLAAKEPGHQVENPRQVSAYRYPKEYGPQSPSFARATFKQTHAGYQLFIAGTASIVGHASRHVGDAEKQTAETIDNLNALIEHAESLHGIEAWREGRRGQFKVYLRNQESFPTVSAVIRRRFPRQSEVFYLQADICRRELEVEIEAMISWNTTPTRSGGTNAIHQMQPPPVM